MCRGVWIIFWIYCWYILDTSLCTLGWLHIVGYFQFSDCTVLNIPNMGYGCNIIQSSVALIYEWQEFWKFLYWKLIRCVRTVLKFIQCKILQRGVFPHSRSFRQHWPSSGLPQLSRGRESEVAPLHKAWHGFSNFLIRKTPFTASTTAIPRHSILQFVTAHPPISAQSSFIPHPHSKWWASVSHFPRNLN